MSFLKKYFIPFTKVVLGSIFLLLSVLGGIGILLDQFNAFVLLATLVVAFISFKVTISGWRSYSSAIGTYEDRKKKAELKAEKFKAKMELKAESMKGKGEKLQAQYEKDLAERDANVKEKEIQRRKERDKLKRKGISWKQARQEQKSQQIKFERDLADCKKFAIKVSFWEKITLSLKDETLYALQNERKKIAEIKKKQTEQAKVAREAKAAARAAKIAEKEAKEEAKKQKLIEKYEKDVDSNVIKQFQKKAICLGMPQEMVDSIYGPKWESKKSVSANKEKLRCKYGRGSQNQRGNYTYKLEVVYENRFVKSFKEL